MDWERPVNMEYFVPENGKWTEVLNQEVTFMNFGGWTRFSEGNKDFQFRTSFKLKANKVYEFQNYYPSNLLHQRHMQWLTSAWQCHS